jgi:hypothetical protein
LTQSDAKPEKVLGVNTKVYTQEEKGNFGEGCEQREDKLAAA